MNEISEALGNHEVPPEKQDWRNPAPMLEVVLDACGRGGAVARKFVHPLRHAAQCSVRPAVKSMTGHCAQIKRRRVTASRCRLETLAVNVFPHARWPAGRTKSA
jgi:hypothetical protein